jgi:ABC-2 type transport system permease protein
MNLRTIGLIINREYMTRVRKKSFLLITFLAPVLFAAVCLLPTIIMMNTKEEGKKVAVVDESGIVMPVLGDTETMSFFDCTGLQLDSLKANLGNLGYDAVLSVSALDPETKTLGAEIYSSKPLGMDMTEVLNSRINSAVENYRVASYNIEGLEQIMQDVKPDIKLRSYTLGEDGEAKISESGVYMFVSMILGMVIYMFISIFGGMVSSSVIEEKSSRVVEVLISSVKATELMFGKIIGIALVAMTQFLLWILLTGVIVGVVGAFAGPQLIGNMDAEQISQMASGSMGTQMGEVNDAALIISSLSNMNLGLILVCFVAFFLLGYMLYASFFAAIGSAVENEGDSNQLTLPATVPLLLGFFIALYAFKAPDSAIVFWGSIIPFTSPIVMLARLPFGVPGWEIALSFGLLALTFIACAWMSAKIYKVGILMFGKKSTWKDLWKWLKQK